MWELESEFALKKRDDLNGNPRNNGTKGQTKQMKPIKLTCGWQLRRGIALFRQTSLVRVFGVELLRLRGAAAVRQPAGRGGRRGSTSSPRRRRAIRQLAVQKTAVQGRVTQATVCRKVTQQKSAQTVGGYQCTLIERAAFKWPRATLTLGEIETKSRRWHGVRTKRWAKDE